MPLSHSPEPSILKNYPSFPKPSTCVCSQHTAHTLSEAEWVCACVPYAYAYMYRSQDRNDPERSKSTNVLICGFLRSRSSERYRSRSSERCRKSPQFFPTFIDPKCGRNEEFRHSFQTLRSVSICGRNEHKNSFHLIPKQSYLTIVPERTERTNRLRIHPRKPSNKVRYVHYSPPIGAISVA